MTEQTVALLNKLVAEYHAQTFNAANPLNPQLDDEQLMVLACALADCVARAVPADALGGIVWEDCLPPAGPQGLPLSPGQHAAFEELLAQ